MKIQQVGLAKTRKMCYPLSSGKKYKNLKLTCDKDTRLITCLKKRHSQQLLKEVIKNWSNFPHLDYFKKKDANHPS